MTTFAEEIIKNHTSLKNWIDTREKVSDIKDLFRLKYELLIRQFSLENKLSKEYALFTNRTQLHRIAYHPETNLRKNTLRKIPSIKEDPLALIDRIDRQIHQIEQTTLTGISVTQQNDLDSYRDMIQTLQNERLINSCYTELCEAWHTSRQKLSQALSSSQPEQAQLEHAIVHAKLRILKNQFFHNRCAQIAYLSPQLQQELCFFDIKKTDDLEQLSSSIQQLRQDLNDLKSNRRKQQNIDSSPSNYVRAQAMLRKINLEIIIMEIRLNDSELMYHQVNSAQRHDRTKPSHVTALSVSERSMTLLPPPQSRSTTSTASNEEQQATSKHNIVVPVRSK